MRSVPPPARVVLLADYGGAYAGTFLSMIRAIVREARGRGHEAEVIFSAVARDRPWLAELERDHIAYSFAPAASTRGLVRWLRETVLARGGRIILHTHFTKFDVPAALAARGRSSVSVFWHVHSPAPKRLVWRLRNILKYALVGRLVSAIFCVAPDIAADVRSRGGSRERVVFMPNAIETGRFPKTAPDERAAARETVGLPLAAEILLHFGWDWKRKGGDTFVQSVGALVRDRSQALGVTVGGGDTARAAVAALALGHCVRVLEPRDDVRTLYAAADLFLSPSVAEGMPFAMTEALCTGLAVVGSDIPGQAAIGGALRACRLVAAEPEALAAAARAMLERDAATRAAEGQAARNAIVAGFDLSPWARRLVDYYARTPR